MRVKGVFVFAILTIGLLSSCKRELAYRYRISGHINVDSGMIYLQTFSNKMFTLLDSSEIRGGEFSFTGSLPRAELYGLTLNRSETFSPYYIFLGSSPVVVTIDTADHRRLQVEGSVEHDLFEAYHRADRRSRLLSHTLVRWQLHTYCIVIIRIV